MDEHEEKTPGLLLTLLLSSLHFLCKRVKSCVMHIFDHAPPPPQAAVLVLVVVLLIFREGGSQGYTNISVIVTLSSQTHKCTSPQTLKPPSP